VCRAIDHGEKSYWGEEKMSGSSGEIGGLYPLSKEAEGSNGRKKQGKTTKEGSSSAAKGLSVLVDTVH